MRPLPLTPIAGAPAFVSGLAIVRGEALPVVDLATLLGEEIAATGRFVTIRSEDRRLVLAVGAVAGIRHIADDRFQAMPPLLNATESEAIAAVGVQDSALLFLLQAARLMPDDAWAAIERAHAS